MKNASLNLEQLTPIIVGKLRHGMSPARGFWGPLKGFRPNWFVLSAALGAVLIAENSGRWSQEWARVTYTMPFLALMTGLFTGFALAGSAAACLLSSSRGVKVCGRILLGVALIPITMVVGFHLLILSHVWLHEMNRPVGTTFHVSSFWLLVQMGLGAFVAIWGGRQIVKIPRLLFVASLKTDH